MNKMLAGFNGAVLRVSHHGRWLMALLLLACLPPAFATPTTPTSDFTDNGDGTVTHNPTGLTWMRCSLGQTWTGTTCSGTASTYTYDEALPLTLTFAGNSDWRLPNIAELQTLVERSNFNPTINTEMFLGSTNDAFWSSSTFWDSGFAWVVYFYDGYVNGYERTGSLAVRLVRANRSLGIGLTTPDTDFIDNKDGTVTHKSTGLMWQRCAFGQAWTGSECTGNANTYLFDAAQNLTDNLAGYGDWRMPTANELTRLINYYDTNTSRMINTTMFTYPSNMFWSSSPFVGFGGAWSVNFLNGEVNHLNPIFPFFVRLVRASQSLVIDSADLSTSLTASTNRVALNQNITYTATVTNTGTAAATNATLIFYFPPRGTSYVTVPHRCGFNGRRYSCSVSSLAAGASFSRSITVRYARRGATNIVGLGITDSVDSNSSNNSSEVITVITR